VNSVVGISGSFNFTDPGGDLNGGSFNFTYNGSTTTVALGAGFAGVTSGSGQIIGPVQLDATAGAVAIPCWLVDRAGNRSNTVYVNFTQTVARFAYLVNDDSTSVPTYGTISAYAIDASTAATTGTLRHNGYYLAGGGHNRYIAVDPSQRFVYVPSYNDHCIYEYTITPTTGALAPIGSIGAGASPISVAVDPSGRFAYAADWASGNIYEYTITPNTGALAAIAGHTFIGAGTNSRVIAVDPYGRFAYALDTTGAKIYEYSIDPNSGALTLLGSIAAGTNPYFLVVEPTGSFVYVGDHGSTNIYIYAIQTNGTLTPGSPMSALSIAAVPDAIAADPSGTYLYEADGSNSVYRYTIDSTTGALTAGTSAGTGGTPSGVAVDPTTGFVYVSITDDNTIAMYKWISGTLTLVGKISTRNSPYQMAMMFGPSRATYVPQFAYVANNNSGGVGNVSQYTIAPATGLLTQGSPATVGAGTGPQAIAADPLGRSVYVANYNSGGTGNVSQYTIAPATGLLTQGSPATVAAGTHPQAVAVDPSGQFAYVADYATTNIYEYTMQSAGALGTPPATVAADTNPYSVAVDPSGRFAYVANNGANDVSQYAIDHAAGTLSALSPATVVPGAAAWTNPQVIAVEPSGRFAYLAATSSGGIASIYVYSQVSTGALSSVQQQVTLAAGANPQSMAFDPLGRFAYVACPGTNTVYGFSITLTGVQTGWLTSPTTVSVTGAWGVAVDPSGKYAYVTSNSGSSNNVYVYSIDQVTGALTSPVTATAGTTAEGIAVVGTIQ
jgi:6-phosphogluconolactonase (cycloisomerase 2 family)